jgi:hypothetical protein
VPWKIWCSFYRLVEWSKGKEIRALSRFVAYFLAVIPLKLAAGSCFFKPICKGIVAIAKQF